MRPHLVAAVLCFLIPLAVFWPATGHDFIAMDDPIYVESNPHVLGGLTPEGIRWAFSTTRGSIVAPLTWISYMVDVSVSGPQPSGFHRTNVVLHALNSLLLMLLLWRATGSWLPSALVALLFALHPLRVESVAWVTERKDVLSTAFLLGAMHLYLDYVRQPSSRRMIFVALAMLGGLLAKPMVVVLPLLLLALDHWPLARSVPFKQRAMEKWPLFTLSALFSLLTVLAHGGDGGGAANESLFVVERLTHVPAAYGFQVQKWVWPHDLAALYPLKVTVPLGSTLLGLVVIAGMAGLGFALRSSVPAVTAGVSWFLLGLLPVSGVVSVGIAHLADRFGYVPGMGLAIAVVFGLAAVARGHVGLARGFTFAGVVAVITLTVMTRPVLARWENTGTLFRHTIEVTGGSGYAYNYLGGWLGNQGRNEEALRMLRRAIALDPDLDYAHTNLAQALLNLGDVEAALRHSERAVQLAPHRMQAQLVRGNALLMAEQFGAAERAFERAIRLEPAAWRPHYSLGQLHMVRGDGARARAELREALRLSPGNVRVLGMLRRAGG